MRKLAVVILAAGKGKRMKSGDLPKVLVKLSDIPIIQHVLNNLNNVIADKIILVVGHQKQKVKDYINSLNKSNIEFAIQDEQLGTGHAVMQAADNLSDFEGDVLILAGDVPLLTPKTIKKFIELHNENNSNISVLSTIAPDSKGYGRIVRDENGDFIKIVEEKDADDTIRTIKEINSGIFLVDSKLLFSSLKKVKNNNAQAEYYLTDIIDIVRKNGESVYAFDGAEFNELQGINSPEDLERAEQSYKNNFNN